MRIRFVGEFPLFSGSYVLVIVTLLFVGILDWLNTTQFALGLSYPIPVPAQTAWLLLGGTSLAVGSTIFEVACPPRVKEFSYTRWVEELGRPGALHRWESARKPATALTCMLFLGFGVLAVGYVAIERFVRAIVVAWATVL